MLKNSGEPMRSVTPAALDQCCQLVHMPGPSLDTGPWKQQQLAATHNGQFGQFKTPQNLRSKFLDDFRKKVFKGTFAHRAWVFF